MAQFSLVHGAWGLGLQWDLVRAELEARGHTVHTPDLPCEDMNAGIEEYAAAVPAADIVVGHSLGGYTIPLVEARAHVFLTAGVGAAGGAAMGAGFGDGQLKDELGRSYYPDPAVAAAELQYPPECAELASTLRPQAPITREALPVANPV
jgi:pimeloyl-ACP methyl ester carboxylesterase